MKNIIKNNMKTKIDCVHEEQYSDGSRTLGVLYNYQEKMSLGDTTLYKESLIYIYREGMYIFFNTMVDLIDYLLYGETKMKRAYMPEDEFDAMYDLNGVDGKFSEKLKWV